MVAGWDGAGRAELPQEGETLFLRKTGQVWVGG